MMKRMIIILGSAFLLIVMLCVFLLVREKREEDMFVSSGGILNVCGKNITDKNVTIHYKPNSSYAELPLTEVLKNMEFDVKWLDDNTSHITLKDEMYILKLNPVSLTQAESDYEILLYAAPVGGRSFCKVVDRELILDDVTIMYVMSYMGIDVFVDINHNESIVYVDLREVK